MLRSQKERKRKKKEALMSYREKKEKTREEAIEWQSSFSENSYSYSECSYFAEYFKKKGKKYGLLTEFKENSII